MGGVQGHVFAAGLLTINNIYCEICLRSEVGVLVVRLARHLFTHSLVLL